MEGPEHFRRGGEPDSRGRKRKVVEPSLGRGAPEPKKEALYYRVKVSILIKAISHNGLNSSLTARRVKKVTIATDNPHRGTKGR